VPVKLGPVVTDHPFLVSPQLLTSGILGVHFFINTAASIDFSKRCAFFKVNDKTTRQLFGVTKDDSATISGNSASGYTGRDVFHVSTRPLKTSVSLPIEEHRSVISETSIFLAKMEVSAVVKVMISVLFV